MLVVADSSALVALATCSALDFLLDLYETINVPQAVFDEVTIPTKPQATLLKEFLKDRIELVDTSQLLMVPSGLGQGEIEAMSLYKKLSADYLLIDDRRARKIAEANQINCIGVLGVLLLAKKKKIVTQISPYIDTLRQSSIHYGDDLLSKVLQLAGESSPP